MDLPIARLFTSLLAVLSYCKGDTSMPFELGNVDKAWSASRGPGLGGRPNVIKTSPGQSVQLVCTGLTSSIAWDYPEKDGERSNHGYASIEVVQSAAGGEWYSTLTLVNLTYLDTGAYVCACQNRTQEHAASHSRARATVRLSVYMFVQDNDNLFQGRRPVDGITFIVGVTGRSMVIPCAVTAPDARVRLYRGNSSTGSLQYEWSGSPGTGELDESELPNVNYDPKLGFTIERLAIRHSGPHSCTAERDGAAQEKRLYIHTTSGSPSAIITPWISSKSGFSAVEGSSITMRCMTMILKGNPVTMTWIRLPENVTLNNAFDKRITVRAVETERVCPGDLADCAFKRQMHQLNPILSAYNKVINRIRIKPVNSLDSGTFACRVSTVGHSETTKREVTVYNTVGNTMQDATVSKNEEE